MEETKKCKKCGETKGLNDFGIRTGTDKRLPVCRVCKNKESAEIAKARKLGVPTAKELARQQEKLSSTRVCSCCGTEKLKSEYYITTDGWMHTQCNECRSTKRKQHYYDNREEQLAKSKAWNVANPERVKENNRRSKAARVEETRAYSRQYRKDNYEACLNSNRNWAKNNPEKKKQSEKNWIDRNREKVNAKVRNRTAAKRGVIGKHTAAEVKAIEKEQPCCVYCGYEFKPKPNGKLDRHADHIFPIKAKDGITANFKENLQLLCQPCNDKKLNADPIEHERKIGFLTPEREAYLKDLKRYIIEQMLLHGKLALEDVPEEYKNAA